MTNQTQEDQQKEKMDGHQDLLLTGIYNLKNIDSKTDQISIEEKELALRN